MPGDTAGHPVDRTQTPIHVVQAKSFGLLSMTAADLEIAASEKEHPTVSSARNSKGDANWDVQQGSRETTRTDKMNWLVIPAKSSLDSASETVQLPFTEHELDTQLHRSAEESPVTPDFGVMNPSLPANCSISRLRAR